MECFCMHSTINRCEVESLVTSPQSEHIITEGHQQAATLPFQTDCLPESWSVPLVYPNHSVSSHAFQSKEVLP